MSGRGVVFSALLCGVGVLAGCASGGSGQVHGSMYMGVGYYDPWYWGPCCHDTVIVGPPNPSPPGARPDGPHVEQPIAKPPPSAPAARPLPASPRPVATPRAGGGRRR